MASLPCPSSWVEVIYVIPLYRVSQGLNLNLSSMGGHSLKLTDYCRAEARRYLPDRAKTDAETMSQSRGRKVETEARPCEAEARPSQLKNCLEPRGRLEQRQMPQRLHPWISLTQTVASLLQSSLWLIICLHVLVVRFPIDSGGCWNLQTRTTMRPRGNHSVYTMEEYYASASPQQARRRAYRPAQRSSDVVWDRRS